MRFMLLVCAGDDFDPPETIGADSEAWVEEMDGRGVRTLGDQLAGPSDATTVRVRDGELLLSDGPFAETKEHIAGFDIIECANLDEAIEVAAKHPMSAAGSIEIRPFGSG